MNGAVISAAFGSSPGLDCLRDVIPKVGQRLKVCAALKGLLETSDVHNYIDIKYNYLLICRMIKRGK